MFDLSLCKPLGRSPTAIARAAARKRSGCPHMQAAEMHRQNADLKTENKELLGHASDLMDRFKKLTLEREALEIELRKTQVWAVALTG